MAGTGLMFKHSLDADIEQLAVFSTPATNTSVREKRFIEYPTDSSLNSQVIKFKIHGDQMQYYDLKNTRLYVRCHIEDINGEKPTEDATVFPINHLLQSMWKYVEVYVGGKLISHGSDNFPYKSMIRTLLHNCNTRGQVNVKSSELFFPDTPHNFDVFDPLEGLNTGMDMRKAIAGTGESFDMEGPLNESCMQLNRYILNGLDIEIRLHRASDSFILMTQNKDKKYHLKLEEVTLKVCTVDVGSAIVMAHAKGLEKGGLAQYFFTQDHIQAFNASKGDVNFSRNIYSGNLPYMIVVAIVDARRHVGEYDKNPFLFGHYDAKSVSCLVNDISIPGRPMTSEFLKGRYAAAYTSFAAVSENCFIDYEAYKGGYTMWVFNINPKENDEDLRLLKSGNIRLDIPFGTELPEPVQVIVFGHFHNCFQIDELRKVFYEPLK